MLRRSAVALLANSAVACTGDPPGLTTTTSSGVASDTSDTAGEAGSSAASGSGPSPTPSTTGDDPDTTAAADGSTDAGTGVDDPGTLDSDARIYTADGTEFTIDGIGEAFAHALTDADVDNAILYVHGRACGGGEPQKSLSEAIPALEADYTARAVMFVWQGADDGCPLGFPEDRARAAGPALAHALRKLAWARSQTPAAFDGIALTFITHSMGSLVLEEAIESEPTPLPAALFDTVMIGSAASARDGHAAWVAEVGMTDHLYVSDNDDDLVLSAAGIGGVRLGKNVDGTPLAGTAIYVDFTATSVNHAYYIHDGQDGAPMTAFYDAIMNGEAFDFATADGIDSVEMRDGTAIYRFSP